MELTDTSERTIINVVDQYDYSTQNDAYVKNSKKLAEKINKTPTLSNFKQNHRERLCRERRRF